jgi:galactose oxidase-like protein
MTYDSYDGYVLLLGATGGSGRLNGTETWTYSAGVWAGVSSSQSPESCQGSVLAYDDVDQYVVYLGGANLGAGANCSSAGQTWTYQGGSWSQVNTSSGSPPDRQGAAFTNDSADGYMLLFGGISPSCGTVCNDTWSFVGGTWTHRNPANFPSNRSGAGMAYDTKDGYVLLFGGSSWAGCSYQTQNSPYCMDRDTWSYKGGNWVQLSPVGPVPPEPYDDGLVYDAAAQQILYTVTDDNFSREGEIWWTFHAGNWSNPSTNGNSAPGIPSNRFGEGLAYDYKDGYDVLFGGTGIGWERLSDTWSYSNASWTNVTLASGFSSRLSITPNAGDTGTAIVLATSVFGAIGSFTYAYSGLPSSCATENLPMFTCTPSAAGTYGILVAVRNSTGSYSNSSATLVVYPRIAVSQFVIDPSSVRLGGSTVLNVVTTGGGGPIQYLYTGLPWPCSGWTVAAFTCVPSTTGVFPVNATAYDSTASATATATLTVTAQAPGPPAITFYTVSPSQVVLGQTVEYDLAGTGDGPFTVQYSGLPTGCSSANLIPLYCTPSRAGTYPTEVSLADVYGQTVFANVTLVVTAGYVATGQPLAIVAFFASPAVVSLGGTTAFEVFVQGGAPPYRFAYAGLPAGCRTFPSAELTCSPTGTANTSTTVTVTDANGNATSATTTLFVTLAFGGGSAILAATGPTWPEFGVGVVVGALAVGMGVAYLLRRRRPPLPRA